jgi:hypothetical protein
MQIQHTITFNVCADNEAAAKEFIKRALAQSKDNVAELVVHDDDTAAALADHNDKHGNAAPAAVAHNLEPGAALALAVEVETAFAKK